MHNCLLAVALAFASMTAPALVQGPPSAGGVPTQEPSAIEEVSA